ncbi:hypothetical protein L915_21715 [Phytophthora nicotianae]|uniref:Uncharacterized protein n=1 Tax=Phytophthora nicotianae TaxID=4792 RepID=W2FJP4_PHYNI|nr:hypothetical protein L915_21715 [Phytophthora nicotianae]ETL24262.1 hypothetical protein L916_21724 [Phytophthora nicotianae]
MLYEFDRYVQKGHHQVLLAGTGGTSAADADASSGSGGADTPSPKRQDQNLDGELQW